MVQTRAVPSVQINGPALRTIRELRGVSCTALARAVQADTSFLARIERGEKRGVGLATFERLVHELQVDPRAIMVDPYVTGVIVARLEPVATTRLVSQCKPSKAA